MKVRICERENTRAFVVLLLSMQECVCSAVAVSLHKHTVSLKPCHVQCNIY